MPPEPGPTNFIPYSQSFSYIPILIIILLVIFGAIVSSSEVAVIALKDARIKKQAEEGNKKAGFILHLMENSHRFLNTVQTSFIFASFISCFIAGIYIFPHLTNLFVTLGLVLNIARILSGVLIVIVLSLIFLVFDQMIPHIIGKKKSIDSAYKSARLINSLAVLFYPFIKICTAISSFISHICGFDEKKDSTNATEEQIMMMVDQVEENGSIAESTKDMISNIFEFDDSVVSEAMTHRTDISAVEDTCTIADVVCLAIKTGYSRIPVYHEDIDNILGLIYVKDLLSYVGKDIDKNVHLTDIMRVAHFVPETNKCCTVFHQMTDNHFQIAVIVDEYGGTEGLITLEDLVEFIVGNIQDEYDKEEEEIIKESESSWNVDGTLSISDIEDLTDSTLPDGDYDTIAGLFVELLGRIPNENEHPKTDCGILTFTALKVEERRISRMRVERFKERFNDNHTNQIE